MKSLFRRTLCPNYLLNYCECNCLTVKPPLLTSNIQSYFPNHRIFKNMSTGPKSSSNVKALFSESSADMTAPLLRHLFEESAALDVYDNSTINLAAGCPGPDLLSRMPGIFKQAMEHRMQQECNDNYYLFQYGPTAGLWGMRETLAKFLTKNYKSEVKREDLVLTCGATHGLHLAVSILLATDGIIFVEEFTYMIALSLLKEFPSHKIIKIPMTKNGVDINKMADIVRKTKAERNNWNISDEKPFWAMFYCIPTFQNPTSALLPPENCRKLVDLAKDLDFLIVCDDVYNLLYFTEDPPARLYSYDNRNDKSKAENLSEGHVISNGSFSKILAPGVRVGWMEMSPKLVQRFRRSGILQSGGSFNNVMYGLMQSLLELGLADEILSWYKSLYTKRMSALCESLRQHLPKDCHFQTPLGGYFLWLKLPVNGTDFLAWCKDNGVKVGAVPALRFVPYIDDKDSSSNESYKAIRLSIGFHNEDTLRKAGQVLGDSLKTFLEKYLKH